MASTVPPIKNSAFTFYVSLVSQVNRPQFQANPTLAAGDVKVATDDAAPANITTLPVVDADFTKRVKVSLSASEMNGDVVSVIFSDATGDEWDDVLIDIQTSAQSLDTIDTNVDAILDDTGTSGVTVSSTGAQVVADQVWDESQGDHVTGGSFGEIATEIASILSDTGTDGVVISTTTQQAIADVLLGRGVSNVEDTADAHSVAAIILAVLESAISGTTWTIKKTDGATTFTTKTVTLDTDADPITAVS